MAMCWDVSRVKNYKKVCFRDWKDGEGGTLKGLTNCLIWATVGTGICHITEKNYKEFFMRVEIMQKKLGISFASYTRKNGKHGKYMITLEDIKKHIGLKAESQFHSGEEKRDHWIKRMLGPRMFEEIWYEHEREQRLKDERKAWRENAKKEVKDATV